MHTAPGECILFLWQNHNTVVIGKNQDAWKECKVNLLEEGGGYLVRRLSGGGAVYHDAGNLNFTFCVRKEDYDVDRQLSVILRALSSLGISAEKTGRNDITVDGRKISGNAFYTTGSHCYHHGTLLVQVDPEEMGRYLNVDKRKLASKGVDSVRSRVTGLVESCPDLTIDGLADALVVAFSEEYGLPTEQIPDPVPTTRSQLGDESLPEPKIAELTRKFASWEFRLGRKIPFTYELEDRFDWGDIALRFSVEGGVIHHLDVRSDAMDDRLGPTLAKALTGKRYDAGILAQAVENMPLDTNINDAAETRIIRQDIITLIKEKL
jgi:lipoate-protein ligase A